MNYFTPKKVKSKTGKTVEEINIENVMSGKITSEDIKISKDTLLEQGKVAEGAGRVQLKNNFVRASELIEVPDDVLLNVYNMLRPKRCTKEELTKIAYELRNKYRAESCAKLVFQAIEVYEKRGLFLE